MYYLITGVNTHVHTHLRLTESEQMSELGKHFGQVLRPVHQREGERECIIIILLAITICTVLIKAWRSTFFSGQILQSTKSEEKDLKTVVAQTS